MKKIKQIALSVLGMAFIATGFVACSSDDSGNQVENTDVSTDSVSETTTFSSDFDWSRLGRFDFARRSRFCKRGLGICTMKDVDEANEELAEIERELKELEEKSLGIHSVNSIVAPIDPVEDFHGGVMYVRYDLQDVMRDGYLQLNIALSTAPTSNPEPIVVEEDVVTELDGIKDKFLVIEKGDYSYDSQIGEHGGYSIRIKLWQNK